MIYFKSPRPEFNLTGSAGILAGGFPVALCNLPARMPALPAFTLHEPL
jgi:hypothetical protein